MATDLEQKRRPGRKAIPGRVEATVGFLRNELEELDTLAAESGRSRTDLIREAVQKTHLKGRKAGAR